jgi:alcohol dehydrogenase
VIDALSSRRLTALGCRVVRAVVIERFSVPPTVQDVPEPPCPPDGVVVRVAATGLCRSDWHGWSGHDPDVRLPHVPGHEFAGVIEEVGPEVRRWRRGDRVTTPFVCACGRCPTCRRGDLQVCEAQQQPGFTHWGSFAEYVVVDVADLNAVRLPDGMPFEDAAGLGCRFATAYRAVTVHGRPASGDWVAVHGCGGVGLSAVMIAAAAGARVLAVDPSATARRRAAELGAELVVDPRTADPAMVIRDATGGGAAVSLDAIGGVASLTASVACLRPRGRHVQVGLMGAARTVPAEVIGAAVARELELLGSHGMPATDYPAMLERIASKELDPSLLVRRSIGLAAAAAALPLIPTTEIDGITIIDPTRP